MKYYLIAGEASGDLHGANLMKAIRREDPEAQFRVWGGDLMQRAGGELVRHYRDLAFMGFVEVLMNLRTILRNISFCKRDILSYQPDRLVLIDYPGFNLRIARWASNRELRVIYYISPQIWAWHSSRVHGIAKSVDRMLTILPFEPEFYQRYGYEVDFVGHPLLDHLEHFEAPPDFRERHGLDGRPIVALLPGSRRQEIERMLKVMLHLIPHFGDYQFVLAGAPSIEKTFYRDIIERELTKPHRSRITLLSDRTYEILDQAHCALVTSGTATLETALFGVPQVVCYRGSLLSYWIARRLVNVSYIALVNLIVDRKLVPELIQKEFTPENLKKAFLSIQQPDKRRLIKEGYRELRALLGHSGASKRAAELVVEAE